MLRVKTFAKSLLNLTVVLWVLCFGNPLSCVSRVLVFDQLVIIRFGAVAMACAQAHCAWRGPAAKHAMQAHRQRGQP